MPGIYSPEKIDLVMEYPTEGRFPRGALDLIIIHSETWTGSADEQAALKLKLQNYLDFAINQARAQYPDSVDKPIVIELNTSSEPPLVINSIIDQARNGLARYGITLLKYLGNNHNK